MYGGESGDLPTAARLKEMIVEKASLPARRSGYAQEDAEFLSEAVKELRERFGGSGQPSIDRWLELNKQHEVLGKRLIAATLLPLEAEAVSNASISSGWYQWLFLQLFLREKRELHTRNLAFVTFNYDRSLELALGTMLANSRCGELPSPDGTAAGIPIYHVHGQLSSFVRSRAGTPYYDLYPEIQNDYESSKTIHIIPSAEEALQRPSMKSATEELMRANILVFLGFGFDPDNMKRIGAPPLEVPNPTGRHNIRAYVCTYNMSKRQRINAEALLKNSRLNPEQIEVSDLPAHEFVSGMLDLRHWLGIPE